MIDSDLILSSDTFLGLKALSCTLRPPDTSHGFLTGLWVMKALNGI